jgi:hypothetical protein
VTRPSFGDHIAAAWLSALVGGVASVLIIGFGGTPRQAGDSLQDWINAASASAAASLILAPVAIVIFGLAVMPLGPLGFAILRKFGRVGPASAAASGALLSALGAIALAAAFNAAAPDLILAIALAGALAGWTYRGALLAMGFRPPPAPRA